MINQIDADGNDPIFLMFHGHSNDESEMTRILDAVYVPVRADAAPAATVTIPSYISFHTTYARPYMGGNYWYPDDCDAGERQREYAAIRDTVALLLGASVSAHHKKILIGFSQGGYLSYRLVKVHPTLFDAAILPSPSFTGEEQAAPDSSTQFFLAYGAQDHTIPLPDQ